MKRYRIEIQLGISSAHRLRFDMMRSSIEAAAHSTWYWPRVKIWRVFP